MCKAILYTLVIKRLEVSFIRHIYLISLGLERIKIYTKAVILYQIILKQLSVTSTIFLFLSSRLQEHTNSTDLMDARQWIRLLLLRLFEPFVFYNHRTT